MIRRQFESIDGAAELGLLASPTPDELVQLRRAVAGMTDQEKACAEDLTDGEVQRIAEEAEADPAILAIFINGYALQRKRVS